MKYYYIKEMEDNKSIGVVSFKGSVEATTESIKYLLCEHFDEDVSSISELDFTSLDSGLTVIAVIKVGAYLADISIEKIFVY